jgi:hypothetical protein
VQAICSGGQHIGAELDHQPARARAYESIRCIHK